MIECNCMIPVMNYGSSASYKAEPTPEQIANGVIPLDSLPAAWWNCMWSQTNTAVNQARDELGQLITELNNVLCNAGVCPQDTCTDQLYQSINKIRQTLANATTAGAVKSSSEPSEVNVNPTTGIMTVNCLGNAASLTTTARTVVGAVNELKSTYDCCFSDTATAIGGKAPTAHASTATTYGVGNADCYGHLKISDTYTSVLSACSGVAASQMAVACVYCYAAGVAAGVAALGNTNGCALGTAAAGTASTAARSDHVHPTTGLATVKCENGYWGLGFAGSYDSYLRTPTLGLIPYGSNSTSGCGVIGTATWPFTGIYAKTFYGALSGNASTATCATCATCATSAGSATNATNATNKKRCAATAAYDFDILLTNGCTDCTVYDWVSACCRLRYCNTTGALRITNCLGNTAGSITASKFYGSLCGSACIANCLFFSSFVSGDRQIVLKEGSGINAQSAGYSGCCTLTFAPATGVLTAKCFCGNASTATGVRDCSCSSYTAYIKTPSSGCWSSAGLVAVWDAAGNSIEAMPVPGLFRGCSTYGRKSNFTHYGVTFNYSSSNYGTVSACIPANSNYFAFIYACHCCGSCKCYCGPFFLGPGSCCPLGTYWCCCADNESYKKVSVLCIAF